MPHAAAQTRETDTAISCPMGCRGQEGTHISRRISYVHSIFAQPGVAQNAATRQLRCSRRAPAATGAPGGARPTRTAAPPPARDLPPPAQALSPSASLRGSVTAPNGVGRAPCAAPHNKTPPPRAAGSHGHQLRPSAPPIHSSLSPTPTSRLSLPIRLAGVDFVNLKNHKHQLKNGTNLGADLRDEIESAAERRVRGVLP